jgi:tRNA G46 methylase TrmB
LLETVERHRIRAWQQPLHAPTMAAFSALQEFMKGDDRPLVLDSGCGTGASTRILGRMHPDCRVIGVDKSADRLSRTGAVGFPHSEGNVSWLRGDLTTFWRLAEQAGWQLSHHYLLYPNPWPKPGQLQRRWHAHPVFPGMLRLGGQLELRCNWRLYAEEFCAALNHCLSAGQGQSCRVQDLDCDKDLSPFEAKYRASGHLLYSVSTRLP